jgi:hypothetical protein
MTEEKVEAAASVSESAGSLAIKLVETASAVISKEKSCNLGEIL